MASRLLRNIAVSIGAGLAAGFARRVVPQSAPRRSANFYPILDRLENIETRVARVELTPPPIVVPEPEEIEALGTLVSSHAEDISSLREELARIERRNSLQAEAFGDKIAQLECQVPLQIEARIAARIAELEHRLRGEFQEIHYRTVDAFAETIENRVVNRINVLENSLIEQSRSIVSLREKTAKTDDSLQRLLQAVEKLCERAEGKAQVQLVTPDEPAPTPVPAAPPEEPIEPAAERFRHYVAQRSEVPRGFKPVGMAILGLALIGFRLIK